MTKTSNKNEKNILLSNSAINQFKKILIDEDKNSFIRLLVDSGGCSGFSYKFSVYNSVLSFVVGKNKCFLNNIFVFVSLFNSYIS